MTYILNESQNKIYYEVHNKNNYSEITPYVVFLHGYSSSKKASKALYLKELALEYNFPYVCFDLRASGESEGNILNATIGKWLKDVELVLNHTTKGKQKVLVGSSLGGWLAVLYCLKHPSYVHSLLGIAPALDFHKDMLASFSSNQIEILHKQGFIEIQTDPKHDALKVPLALLEDAKNYELLNKNTIEVTKPFVILHGMQDDSVDFNKSIKILQKIQSKEASLILHKNSNHSFSTSNDLEEIKTQVLKLLNMNN